MSTKSIVLTICLTLVAVAARAQVSPRFNFNIGGGVGFPLGTTSDFVGNGATFVVGAGPNFTRYLGLSGEFMWNDLPIKQSVAGQLGVPSTTARQYSLTLNAILHNPGTSKFGAYVIGGGGWYHRSGEATASALVPGTVCPAFWVWWGTCISGLWPANVTIASFNSNAFGVNIGGGGTFKVGESGVKAYTEIRYHHASHNNVSTDLLPLTFGIRW
jgi:hypothetical protein